MKKILYIIVSISLLSATSCRTAKQVATTSLIPPSTEKGFAQPDIRTANFNSLMVRVKMGGNEFSSRASMKIIKDSIIQVSVMPVLGIEAARMNLTPKSVLIINKMNNLYYQADYDSLLVNNGIPARFKDLQAMLLNRLFMVGNQSSSVSELLPNFERTELATGTMLRSNPAKQQSSVRTEFMLDESKMISYCSVSYSQGALRCYYSNFMLQNDILFPFKYKINLAKGGYADQEAEMQINNAEFNKDIKINIANLSNYTRVYSIEELYK